jgi:hypothetical protein
MSLGMDGRALRMMSRTSSAARLDDLAIGGLDAEVDLGYVAQVYALARGRGYGNSREVLDPAHGAGHLDRKLLGADRDRAPRVTAQSRGDRIRDVARKELQRRHALGIELDADFFLVGIPDSRIIGVLNLGNRGHEDRLDDVIDFVEAPRRAVEADGQEPRVVVARADAEAVANLGRKPRGKRVGHGLDFAERGAARASPFELDVVIDAVARVARLDLVDLDGVRGDGMELGFEGFAVEPQKLLGRAVAVREVDVDERLGRVGKERDRELEAREDPDQRQDGQKEVDPERGRVEAAHFCS